MSNPVKLEINIACPEDFPKTAMAGIVGTEVFQLLRAMFRKEWADKNITFTFRDFQDAGQTSELSQVALNTIFNPEMVAQILNNDS